MKTRKEGYKWDPAKGVYYDETQCRRMPPNSVHQDVRYPSNRGIWKKLQWLQVWDLWLIVAIRKHLLESLWNHAKHFGCIIFSITLFTGVLIIQRSPTQHNNLEAHMVENEVLAPLKKSNISAICQAQNCLLNHAVQEEIKENIYNNSENKQTNINTNIPYLLKSTELQSFKESGCNLTETSIKRIVQDELGKYDDQKRRNKELTPDISENTLRKIVNDELMKYSKGRMNSIASITKTLETTIRKVINDELTRYDADKLGIPDYALESVGGRIVSASDTDGYGTGEYVQIFGFNIWRIVTGGPRNLIQPSVHPGSCWAFRGSYANAVIQLARPIRVTAVTMEHIPVSISPAGNINSAPKEFAVNGLTERDAKHQIHLGSFTYLKDGPSRQYFVIMPEKNWGRDVFQAIELWILSNHGNPDFTCVYRIRVHGQLSD